MIYKLFVLDMNTWNHMWFQVFLSNTNNLLLDLFDE